ncbi:TIGR02611 family protein [Streptomyces sp. HNM0574]|uniref:TIGR02611 family protein n=1 Tax=Streptomyces sp. HNM0574 TaxID=2714954 RepID=UPI00146A42EC|nr:TIGR02611 family protein [Streptomyces sp. HNM0574]NLU66315.1 TIGR02611 family protein [Streptomyces sp. HNM0574]
MSAESAERTERHAESAGATADSAVPEAGSTATGGTEKPLGSRAPHFIKRSRPLHISWQVVIFVIGLAIVVGGVIMLPLPGPGWLVIFAGIGVWGTEFPWAQRVLRWTKQKLQEWTHWVKRRREERLRRKQERKAGAEERPRS